jgi:cholinesterase
VWIYGGGYTEGAKSAFNGSGLIAQSQRDGRDGVVFVALNYRLGLFGWLSGPSFQEQGTGNLGLWDQRLALKWVQENIHLFGGDPDRVTVMGESAGGGSIMHQITAFGGAQGKAPFQQAISQSAAWGPLPAAAQNEAIFTTTLATASEVTNSSITTFDQLQALSSSTLQTINKLVVTRSTFGTFTYGPSVDGNFVPALPGLLLLHGQFDRDLKLLIGHNSAETAVFTSPVIQTDIDFDNFLRTTLPEAEDSVISFIEDTLYPAVFDGSFGYMNDNQRAQVALAENAFTCNTRYLAHAFYNETYNYFFEVPPGLHGQDIAYTFFNGDTTTSNDGTPVNATIATQLQDFITNFATSGDPNVGVAVPPFPQYGADSIVVDIDSAADGMTMVDGLAETGGRCEWWQLALYA